MLDNPDQIVRQLLDYIEEHIDLEHVWQVHQRHLRALNYETVDRLPLVFYLPYEGEGFSPYPYREAFEDPAKMMVNELLTGFTSIYHAVNLKDDAPYCLRPNLGTVIIASMFGSNIVLADENSPPWAEKLGSISALRAMADGPLPDIDVGLGKRVVEQYAYFDEALRDYPNCREAFQITMPDLQGPFSTVELLWGSSIYIDMYDNVELIRLLLKQVTDQLGRVFEAWSPYVKESLGKGFCYQHNVGVKGNMLIRNDSIILISSQMYRDIVLEFDQQISDVVDGAGMHFCGKGQHQVGNLLSIPTCHSIDMGQPEMNDVNAIYVQAKQRQVPLTRIQITEEDASASNMKKYFPTGVNLIGHVQSFKQAQQLWHKYLSTN